MAGSGDILRGHTETIILRILGEGDSYGYEIAKAIIEGQGGALTVESAPGEGTRFTALFPTGEGAGTDLTIS